MKSLIKQGADFHIEEERALITSAKHGHLDVVKYLVEQGVKSRY